MRHELVRGAGRGAGEGHDGQLGGRLGREEQRAGHLVPVVGGDGGHRPVPAHALVQLRLQTQELLEVVPAQVEARHVAAHQVGPHLLHLIIHGDLGIVVTEPEHSQGLAQVRHVRVTIIVARSSVPAAFLPLLALAALLVLAAVGLDVVQHGLGPLLLAHLAQSVVAQRVAHQVHLLQLGEARQLGRHSLQAVVGQIKPEKSNDIFTMHTTNISRILLLDDGPVGGDVGCQGLQLVVVCRDLGQLGQPRTLEAAEAGEAVAWTEGGHTEDGPWVPSASSLPDTSTTVSLAHCSTPPMFKSPCNGQVCVINQVNDREPGAATWRLLRAMLSVVRSASWGMAGTLLSLLLDTSSSFSLVRLAIEVLLCDFQVSVSTVVPIDAVGHIR